MDNPSFDNDYEDVDLPVRTSIGPSTDDMTAIAESELNHLTDSSGSGHYGAIDTEFLGNNGLYPTINGAKSLDNGQLMVSNGGSGYIVGGGNNTSTASDFSNLTTSTDSSSGNTSGSSDTNNDEEEDITCGIGVLKPTFLQRCMTMGHFTFFFCFAGMVSSALNVYMSSQITTLEKHFNFSSSFSGLLLSCNDLGYLSTTLLCSYFTRRVHIPRALALATFLFGLSGLLCTVPFFMTESQLPSPPNHVDPNRALSQQAFTQMCTTVLTAQAFNTSSNVTCPGTVNRSLGIKNIDPSLKNFALLLLALGMIVQGMAKSPRQPFLATYIDDNVPKIKSAMYLGIVSGFSTLGPALAFALGGLFSRIYVTLEETDMSVRDPRWIGAWWLGFFLFGSIALIVALPISCFPRSLRGRRHLEGVENSEQGQKQQQKGHSQQKKSETDKSKAVMNELKGFGLSLKRLLTSPVYVCLILSHAVNTMAMTGFLVFQPKYLETQFTEPIWKVNLIIGAVSVSAACIGTVSGGFLSTKFKLSPMACLRFTLICMTLSTSFMGFSFYFGCDQPHIEKGEIIRDGVTYTTNQCIAECLCDSQDFFPVCGADNRNYFSPCHAGCTSINGSNTFKHCSCIPQNITSFNLPEPTGYYNLQEKKKTSSLDTYSAKAGLCEPSCENFYPYIASKFIMTLVGAMGIMPGFIAYIRSVPEKDKPMAIGFNAFFANLWGFGGPVIFGILVDTTCILWKDSCQGGCALYDLRAFRIRYHSLVSLLRVSNCLLLLAALFVAMFSKTFKFQDHEESVKVSDSKPQAAVDVKPGTSKDRKGSFHKQ